MRHLGLETTALAFVLALLFAGCSETKSDPVKIEGKLDDMVRKSLEKYPPKPK